MNTRIAELTKAMKGVTTADVQERLRQIRAEEKSLRILLRTLVAREKSGHSGKEASHAS